MTKLTDPGGAVPITTVDPAVDVLHVIPNPTGQDIDALILIDDFLLSTDLKTVDIYASPDGDDINGLGTSANPYETLRKALDVAGPGGTVIAKDGDYTYLFVVTADSGTSSKYTTIVAENNGGARVTDDPTHHAIETQVNADYIAIDGFDVTSTSDGIKINGANNLVQNNRVHNTTGQGILVVGTGVGTKVLTNILEKCGTTDLDHGIYSSADNVQCVGNLMRDCSGYGIHFYDVAAGMSNCTIQRNGCYNNGTDEGGGIFLHGPVGGGPCGHVVANNYLAVPYGSSFAPLKLSRCETALVEENIFINGDVGPDVYEVACTDTTYTNNIPYIRNTFENTHDAAIDLTEILQNGSFTDPGAGFPSTMPDIHANWSASGGGSSTVQNNSTDPDSAPNCCQFFFDGGNYAQIVQNAVTEVGKVYTLTYRAKSDLAASFGLSTPPRFQALTTSWETYRVTFKATAANLTLGRASAAGATVLIDDVSLVRSYGPDPMDIFRNSPGQRTSTSSKTPTAVTPDPTP